MTTYICEDCGQALRRSEALLRSVRFEQVAYCRDCWSDNHATVVPAPRGAYDDQPAHQEV
jgi:hypothetical protein